MTEHIELQLRKCTILVQFDVKLWFIDIFEEHEDIYIFFSEHIDPRHVHLIVEKHVIRYLKGTIDYGHRYISDHDIRIQGIHRFKLGR
jgi:hypothetical protein